MKTTQTLLAAVILSAGLFTTSAQAALVPALGGKVINDTDLNITWLADADLAATNSFGLARNVDLGGFPGGSYIDNFGNMTWGGAMKWIAAMNTANYLGYSDWRLPTTLQPDASCSSQLGGVSYGNYCTGSEMGHLYYTELGGVKAQPITTTHNANYGLFQNLHLGTYWSGTTAPYTSNAWYLYTTGGIQDYTSYSSIYYAFAVRPGQVAAVPVPAAAWLLGSGLLGLIGVARRRLALR